MSAQNNLLGPLDLYHFPIRLSRRLETFIATQSPPAMMPEYTMPRDDTPRLNQWARLQARRFEDPAGFVNFVMAYYATHFTYSEQVDLPKAQLIDSFFFDAQEGFCAHFAASLVTILRAADIPSHVVLGFYGGSYNPYGEFYTVSKANAHAWVEAKLPDQGWVRLDPTRVIGGGLPERLQQTFRAPQTSSPLFFSGSQGGRLKNLFYQLRDRIIGLNASLTAQLMGADRDLLSKIWIPLAWLSAVFILAGTSLFLRKRLSRKTKTTYGPTKSAHRLERLIRKKLKIPAISSYTGKTFANELAEHSAHLKDRAAYIARDILWLYYGFRYGDVPLAIAEKKIRERLKDFQQAIRP